LVEVGHTHAESLVLKELAVLSEPVISSGYVDIERGDLDNVRSVSSVSSLTSVTSGVSIATSPLEVDVVADLDVQVGGYEIVLSGGVSLDDVSTLALNVQVEDVSEVANSIRTRLDVEDVRTVLESTTELSYP
jgi:hypothetical protein